MTTNQFKDTFRRFCSLYRFILARYTAASILYAVLLFLAVPVLLLLNNIGGRLPNIVDQVFLVLAAPIGIVFTLIFSKTIFDFMHKKRSVDLFLAIPAKRTTLFLSHYAAGLTLLLLPVIVVGGVSMLFCMMNSDTVFMLLRSCLYLVLGLTAAFTFSAFVSVCSGAGMDMVVSILVINIIYPASVWLIFSLSASILPGYNLLGQLSWTLLTALSPFLAVFVPYLSTIFLKPMGISKTEVWFISWWVFIIICLLLLSVLLFKKRKSEAEERGFVFSLPQILIRFVSSLVLGIALGYFFMAVTSYQAVFFWCGAILGSLAAHLTIEAIYSRGFQHLKKSLPYYVSCIGFLAVFYGVFSFGCFGYDMRLPEPSQIESIEVSGEAVTTILEKDSFRRDEWEIDGKNVALLPILTENQSIEQVVGLNQKVIEGIRQRRGFPYRPIKIGNEPEVVIRYRMHNGMVINRIYNEEDLDSAAQKAACEITDLSEYKTKSRIIFNIDAKDIASISIRDTIKRKTDEKENPIDGLTLLQKSNLLDALKADVMDDTAEKEYLWESSTMQDSNYSEVTLYSHKDYYDNPDMKRALFLPSRYVVPSYYHNTIAVLREYGWVSEDF